jgi:hypothetical protein
MHKTFIDKTMMSRFLKFFGFLLVLTLVFTGCQRQKPVQIVITPTIVSTVEPTLIPTAATVVSTATEVPQNAITPTTESNDYSQCGTGPLVEVPYYFTDVNGNVSPTQFMREQTTDDGVRNFMSVTSCLKNDKGWISDVNLVENGYENEIIFFDKFGKAHTYLIIIGGHYVAPYDPKHKDVTGTLDGAEDEEYTVDEWIKKTNDYFSSTGVRQIGLDIYLDDTQGNLSKVLKQVYQFKDTNLLIEKALKSGEGYPDQVPDGFFLFATRAWLIKPD